MRKIALASIAIASLAITACNKDKNKGGSAGGECATVAAKVGEFIKKDMPAAGANLPAEAKTKLEAVFKKMESTVQTACTNDKWPADFTSCVSKATDSKALNDCKLPKELEDKLNTEMEKLMPEVLGAMAAGMPSEAPAADGTAPAADGTAPAAPAAGEAPAAGAAPAAAEAPAAEAKKTN